MLDFLFRRTGAEPGKSTPASADSTSALRPLQLGSHDYVSTPVPAASTTRTQRLRRFNPISRPPEELNRSEPPQVAWLNADDDESSTSTPAAPAAAAPSAPLLLTPFTPSPAQAANGARPISHVHPIGRSVSSPPTSPSYYPAPVPAVAPVKAGLKLHMNFNYSRSTHSLRLDSRHSYVDDGYAFGYPLVKQLSPIAEQDYFSPDGLRRSTALPPSEVSATPTSLGSQQSIVTRSDSITRPSPVYSHSTFITRPLNRTISQTSSRTHMSTGSSTRHISTSSTVPPVIPPLDLRPPFPGPHPSNSSGGSGTPTLRAPKTPTVHLMPTITGSVEDHGTEYDGDAHSLHADSFVTATDGLTPVERRNDAMDVYLRGPGPSLGSLQSSFDPYNLGSDSEHGSTPSVQRSGPSASSSFIDRRWDRNASLGTGSVTFPKLRKPPFRLTPACWIFWLGFFLPPLWLVGGWYFTLWGEMGLTWWSCWTRTGKWRGCGCGARRKAAKGRDLLLPRWVLEKGDLDATSVRMNAEEEALRGIWFGYPFIAPSADMVRSGAPPADVHAGPFSFLGKLPLLRITVVGPPDWKRAPSARRILDPWIWRCRVASVGYVIECFVVFAVLMAVYKPWRLRES